MIETPSLRNVEAQTTAVIRLTIPRSEIQKVMEPAIREVIETLTGQGIAPAGPVFSQHFRLEPEIFDFEVGVPVTKPVAPAGRVVAGRMPACRVAQTVHHGPYEELGAAWGEFMQWLQKEGLARQGMLWERYVTGPETTPDPAGWRTELNVPVAD
jgi:effector-binding domain-containing protein